MDIPDIIRRAGPKNLDWISSFKARQWTNKGEAVSSVGIITLPNSAKRCDLLSTEAWQLNIWCVEIEFKPFMRTSKPANTLSTERFLLAYQRFENEMHCCYCLCVPGADTTADSSAAIKKHDKVWVLELDVCFKCCAGSGTYHKTLKRKPVSSEALLVKRHYTLSCLLLLLPTCECSIQWRSVNHVIVLVAYIQFTRCSVLRYFLICVFILCLTI